MNCPYCKSNDVEPYSEKTNSNGVYFTVYRCYSCARFFDVRQVFTGGEQTSHQGDNFPLLPMKKDWCKEREEYGYFKAMGVVPKRTPDNLADLWIDLWGFLK